MTVVIKIKSNGSNLNSGVSIGFIIVLDIVICHFWSLSLKTYKKYGRPIWQNSSCFNLCDVQSGQEESYDYHQCICCYTHPFVDRGSIQFEFPPFRPSENFVCANSQNPWCTFSQTMVQSTHIGRRCACLSLIRGGFLIFELKHFDWKTLNSFYLFPKCMTGAKNDKIFSFS